jgi:tetratricopeptide (TPR) repeat protein
MLENKALKATGYTFGVALSLWCFGIGLHTLSELKLIFSGLAGFVFGGLGIAGLLRVPEVDGKSNAVIKDFENKRQDQAAASDGYALWQMGRKHVVAGEYEEAKKYLQKAAAKGNKPAISELAKLFLTHEKYDEAEQWWRPLAEQGDAAAQYRLGELLYTLRKNDEADSWIEKSAKQKYHRAVELEKFNHLRIDAPDATPYEPL